MPINVTMPALSPTMTEGNLAKWLKKEGDSVKAGDVLAEIETDKATMEVEAVDEGILGKILVPAGTEKVPVNDVIAVLLEDGESVADIKASKSSAPSPSPLSAALPSPRGEEDGSSAMREPGEGGKKSAGGNRVSASPLARRIASEKNINLSTIKGSGPRGRIVKADLQSAPAARPQEAPKPAPALPGQSETRIPNNNIKKITARRLLESKTTMPHFYLTVDCVIDNLLKAREEINAQSKGAYKLSVNDFVIKAAAMALKAYPAANVSWTDVAGIQYAKADISVAVSTPNGLMTPIVRAAEDKGLKQISAEVKDMAGRAREGKLKPEEFQGGTFTVSNLGMYGIKHFSAIINPPQSCILAVGAGIEQPVVENGQIVIRTVMSCTLSVDHRSVDGAVGAEYLQHFKKFIENPVSMLL
ncbi:MAG: pyruvate dehydrogenase complex dihydrolipoamide acetyltransferase [Alphaproteobacteria bacterium]|nr:pyruvate dehydrogenase complex dihydrolipoamide acetyltransferase [Alphaproteobacteria bacterium]